MEPSLGRADVMNEPVRRISVESRSVSSCLFKNERLDFRACALRE